MKKLFLAFAAVAMVFATSCNNESLMFATEPEAPDNGSDVTHEYVDLGLSVKWATCNIGANNPWEHGNYFSWGETSTKKDYCTTNYRYCIPFIVICAFGEVKYNGKDGKTVLESVDDAATANWGGNWRMPTEAEFTELSNNCTWTWTASYNGTGVPGYVGYSKIPGYTDKSIFLPAAGRYENETLCYGNEGGYYWSSTRSNHTNTGVEGRGTNEAGGYYLQAQYLFFNSSNSPQVHSIDRYLGLPVRPVCP